MKKIFLCCAAGMSTSMVVNKMKQAAAQKGIEAEIIAVAMEEFDNTLPKYDCCLLGPQIKYKFEEFKKKLINEINELNVDGMPKVEKLNALVGKYVNLEYRLPNGQAAKFLNEAKTYLGNQLECEYGGDRCFGVVADIDFILICTYEEDGKNPELVLYKKR